MPLRDHFRPPVWKHHSWEGFHGMWPAAMVMELSKQLPDGYTAEPRVWLADDLYVSLDLESSYETTCRALRIL